jgi:hypothetical protein
MYFAAKTGGVALQLLETKPSCQKEHGFVRATAVFTVHCNAWKIWCMHGLSRYISDSTIQWHMGLLPASLLREPSVLVAPAKIVLLLLMSIPPSNATCPP